MDQQEEAGLERELEAKQEFCKQLQSLFMSLPGSCSSLHLPRQGGRLLPTPVLSCSRIQLCTLTGSQSPHPSSPEALEQSLAQHQELFLQLPPLVPRQQHFPSGYRNSPCSNRIPAPHGLGSRRALLPTAWRGFGSDEPPRTPQKGDFPLCSSLSVSKCLLGECQGEPGSVLAQPFSWEVLLQLPASPQIPPHLENFCL